MTCALSRAAQLAALIAIISTCACGSTPQGEDMKDAAGQIDLPPVGSPKTDSSVESDLLAPERDAATLAHDGQGAASDALAATGDGSLLLSDGTATAPDGAKGATDGPGTSPDGSHGEIDSAEATVDSGIPDSGCVAIPTSALHVSASAASGTVLGNNLNAVLCPGGASAYVESAGARYDTVPYFLLIEWTLGTGAAVDFDFLTPAAANNGELSVMVGLNSASTGSYSSPSGQDCGSLAFTYYLPVPVGVDCAGRSGPNCPPGCGAACSGFGCMACSPQAPSVSYTAQGPTDCMGNSQTPVGSWQLSLTSVDPGEGGTGSGLSYFTPHGSFVATMVAADGSSDTATLSVTF
jgi:hypothetical protein